MMEIKLTNAGHWTAPQRGVRNGVRIVCYFDSFLADEDRRVRSPENYLAEDNRQ